MRLHDFAQARSTSEAIIIEQALALLFGLDDAPLLNDYLFSIAAMREDWDEMPDDWIADEAKDAISSR